jgi:hypothetical protein
MLLKYATVSFIQEQKGKQMNAKRDLHYVAVAKLFAFFPRGSTVLDGPWPPHIQEVS